MNLCYYLIFVFLRHGALIYAFTLSSTRGLRRLNDKIKGRKSINWVEEYGSEGIIVHRGVASFLNPLVGKS